MKQPPENDATDAHSIKTPPEQGPTTWASAQLRAQIRRSGAAPQTGQPTSEQVCEAGGPPLADVEAEPARTAPDHANQPSTGLQSTGTAGRAEGAARRADQHAQAARSVDCECPARAGTRCGPSGDHLARYLRATQSGALTKDSLKDVIAGLDVIAPRALIQPSGERAAAATGAGNTTSQIAPRQMGTGMTAGRAGDPAPEGDALHRGYRAAPAIGARRERELEAGS
ncbi:MAG TPA: hypothetical protein VGQ26_08295 [Streptosporangiaceae bacterium]|jgi:hypothetical protein|nr:hypothetical protein [Streptosporangiaceae bacterium]